jgi:DNA-binding CsgD family transcriptional regulator
VLSLETVRSHVKSILRKLGVRSRQEAVVAARRLRGLET